MSSLAPPTTFDRIRTYVYLAECTLVLLVNIPLILIILIKSSNRQRKEFVMIGALSAADVIYATGFFLSSIRRIVVFSTPGDDFLSMSSCSYQPGPICLFIGGPLLGFVVLFNAIDRLFATVLPIKYYKMGPDFTARLMIVPFIFCFSIYILNLILVLGNETPIPALCLSSDVAHPILKDYYTYSRLSTVFISAVMYLVIIIILKKKNLKNVDGPTQGQQKNFRRANVTVALTTLNAFCLLFVPDFLMKFQIGGTAPEYRMFLLVLILNKTVVNFIIYMFRHRELRIMLLGLVKKKSNSLSVHSSVVNKVQQVKAANTSNK